MSCYTAEEKRSMWEAEDLPTMKSRIVTMQARIDALTAAAEEVVDAVNLDKPGNFHHDPMAWEAMQELRSVIKAGNEQIPQESREPQTDHQ